ncbi:NAD(P)-binding domain-containing protein [Escherichia coli]
MQQGHQLRVFDVNAEAVRHLVDKGATPPPKPRRRPLKMPIYHYHVAKWRSGAQRVVRSNGVCEGLSTDALVIDMSTIHTAANR